MSTIDRCWNFSEGTLKATYQLHDAKQTYKLERFSIGNDGTSIPLSKIHVNTFPANYLKGFKSHLLEEGDVKVVKEGETFSLQLSSFPFKTFNIAIKIIREEEEETLTINAPCKLKGIGLKQVLVNKLEIKDPSSYHLTHGDYPLDESTTLENLGFGEETELTFSQGSLERKPTSKEKDTDGTLQHGGFTDYSFVDPTHQKTLSFSKDAPRWRKVTRGVNFRGECTNKTCQAFQQVIYIPKGMGTFNVAEECSEAKCPECTEYLDKEPKNFGFWDCTYTITGKKVSNERFLQKDQIAPKNAFLTFEEVVDGESNIAQWIFLKVITEPIKQ